MKRHTYTASRATSVSSAAPAVIVQRARTKTWHWFVSEAFADAVAAQINATGRLPNDLGSGQRYFEKLKIFGFPDQYKHYDRMEASI